MLEQDAPVRRLEDVVVADVDLVLAVRCLALAELDGDAGLGHLVAQESMERLGLGGLQQVVILVVVAERPRHRPAPLGQLLPRVAQHVELEFGAGLDGEAGVCGTGDLALEDGPRRDRDLRAGLLVDGVGEDEGGAGQPGQDPELVPDRLGDPVTVAGLPVHQPEAVRRLHLHVRAEQVRAEVGAMADDAVEEGLALDALAHEPALHVGEGDDDRVDAAVADHRLQLGEARMLGRTVGVFAHRSLVRRSIGPVATATGPPEDGPRRARLSGGDDVAGRLLELALDLGQLGVGALALRPLEPVSRPDEVVDGEQDDEPADRGERRRIERERIQE